MREILDVFVETMNATGNPGAERRVLSGGFRKPILGFGAGKPATRRLPEPIWSIGGVGWISTSGAFVEPRPWEGSGVLTPPEPDLFYPPYREPIVIFNFADAPVAAHKVAEGIGEWLTQEGLGWPTDAPSLTTSIRGTGFRHQSYASLSAADTTELVAGFYEVVRAAGSPGLERPMWDGKKLPVRGWKIADAWGHGRSADRIAPVVVTETGTVFTKGPRSGPREFKEFRGEHIGKVIAALGPVTGQDQSKDLRLGMLQILGRYQLEWPSSAPELSPHLRAAATRGATD
jgi:hypothetical protein